MLCCCMPIFISTLLPNPNNCQSSICSSSKKPYPIILHKNPSRPLKNYRNCDSEYRKNHLGKFYAVRRGRWVVKRLLHWTIQRPVSGRGALGQVVEQNQSPFRLSPVSQDSRCRTLGDCLCPAQSCIVSFNENMSSFKLTLFSRRSLPSESAA